VAKAKGVPSWKTVEKTKVGVQDDSYMFKSPFRSAHADGRSGKKVGTVQADKLSKGGPRR
jgi:hypothetical protein